MSDPERPSAVVKSRVPHFILIIIASLVTALLAGYLSDHGLVPENYVLPIYAVIVLVAGYLVIRVVNGILKKVVEPSLGPTHAQGIKNFFSVIVGIVLIVLVFGILGFNLTAVLIGAGFLGIVLGLAGQQVLGNIFAGLSLLISRPFIIGDRVNMVSSLGSVTGTVQEIGIFYTHVLMDNGLPVVLPNSAVLGAYTVNYSRAGLRLVSVRTELDKKLDYDKFKSRVLESFKKYDALATEKSSVEIVGSAATTYEVAIEVCTKSELDEPIRKIIIGEVLKAQEELARA